MTQQFDSQVLKLLNELSAKYEISFEHHDKQYCGVSQKNDKAIIYYNKNNFDNASIAHELLHVWLNKFDYFIGNHIYMMSLSNPKLSKVFSKFLCDYIENLFDHNKMYPKYLEMGYHPKDFIMNGLAEKCSISDIKQLHLKFLAVHNGGSINRFIGYLLSIYADHVENDYTEHLKLLKNKNQELFDIVTNFWNSWLKFDIENVDPIFNSYFDISNKFIDDMELWASSKRIM